MGKVSVRQHVLAQRRGLDPGRYQQLSQAVQRTLQESDLFRRAAQLALYSPINNEVDTAALHSAAAAQGKKIFYPWVLGEELVFSSIESLTELQPGSFGVQEPTNYSQFDPRQLDLIVVPGVAFDPRGNRLGYGRGFYDRLLASETLVAVTVGLCFELQLVPELPWEAHDRPVAALATENRLIPCR